MSTTTPEDQPDQVDNDFVGDDTDNPKSDSMPAPESGDQPESGEQPESDRS